MKTWTQKELAIAYRQESEEARRIIRICRTVYSGISELSRLDVAEPRFIIDMEQEERAKLDLESATISINPDRIRASWSPKATPEEVIESLAHDIRCEAARYWEELSAIRAEVFTGKRDRAAELTAAALRL